MQVRTVCSDCRTTGFVLNHDPYSLSEIVCERCAGVGYHVSEVLVPEYDAVMSKLNEIKTKINQMQADINYIKAKVG